VLRDVGARQVTRPVRQSSLAQAIGATLRLDDTAPAGPEETRPSSAQRPLEGLRVLVAEDNAVNTKLAVMLLERLGCRVLTAGTGVEALAALARNPVDLVLMDCEMPEMDGFAATREIRRTEAIGAHTPIIAMTANAMDSDRARCLEAGMDDYLAKPVRAPQLRAVLERWRPDATPDAEDGPARATG
jgi:CheY-like chemotaxis protein